MGPGCIENRKRKRAKAGRVFPRHRVSLRQTVAVLQPPSGCGSGIRGAAAVLHVFRRQYPGQQRENAGSLFRPVRAGERAAGRGDWSACDEILFVSKSIGTIISAAYVAEQKISCRQILYTPLEDTFRVEEALAESHKQTVSDKQTTAVQVQGTIPSIAFIGTADPWSEVPACDCLKREEGNPHLFL